MDDALIKVLLDEGLRDGFLSSMCDSPSSSTSLLVSLSSLCGYHLPHSHTHLNVGLHEAQQGRADQADHADQFDRAGREDHVVRVDHADRIDQAKRADHADQDQADHGRFDHLDRMHAVREEAAAVMITWIARVAKKADAETIDELIRSAAGRLTVGVNTFRTDFNLFH